jgi:alpha-L-fucosidase
VTELTKAVRGRGLRSGVYYSGGLDWSWYHRPIQKHEDLAAPPTQLYVRYAEQHLMELIDRNKPDVLWNGTPLLLLSLSRFH